MRVGIDVAKSPDTWAYYIVFGSNWAAFSYTFHRMASKIGVEITYFASDWSGAGSGTRPALI